jgi:cytoskeletal protein CcmA (bactofilin family)
VHPQNNLFRASFVFLSKAGRTFVVIEASIMSVHHFSMSVHYFSSCWTARVQEQEGDMFGKSKGDAAGEDRDIGCASEAISSISSGLSIVGKIVGHGAVTIFGHVEGELYASTVVIAEGGQVEGDIVAEELTISGRVEGTIHANRVQLNSTAVVTGDIFHRSLAVGENAQFEGGSRRLKDAIDTSSRVQTNRNQPQTASIDISAGANGSQSAH